MVSGASDGYALSSNGSIESLRSGFFADHARS